jgi:streptogramin lyase
MNPLRLLTRRFAHSTVSRGRPCLPKSRPAVESLEDRYLLSTFNFFNLRSQDKPVYTLAAGPDGNMWFTEPYNDAIGRLTTDGHSLSDNYVPLGSFPYYITAGPDGNMWFTELNSGKIGRMNTDGILLNEYSVPAGEGQPFIIAPGPDGNVWFTERNATSGSWLGVVIVSTGQVKTWQTLGGIGEGVAGGLSPYVWFSTYETAKVGRIDTRDFSFQYFDIPAADEFPGAMTMGEDGTMWMCTNDGGSVLHINVDGTVLNDFPVAPGTANVTVGSDHNLYVDTLFSNKTFYQLTTGGAVTAITIDDPNTNAGNITAGPDGNIWLNDITHNQIGRYNLPGNSGPSSGRNAGAIATAMVQPSGTQTIVDTTDGTSVLPGQSQRINGVFSTTATDQAMSAASQDEASRTVLEGRLLNTDLAGMSLLEDPLAA